MNSAELILRETSVSVQPATYTLVSLQHKAWTELIADPALSPRMTEPFMIFMDKNEVTLLLDETDFGTMRHALREAKTEGGFRLLSFDVELDFSVVGFMAKVAAILADAGVPIVSLSAFSRDHLLIKQSDLSTALKALGPHVAELC